MKKIVIIGAGGLASETINLIEENNSISKEWEILGCLDSALSDRESRQVLGYPILGDDCWLEGCTETIFAVCAIGNPHVRKRIVDHYQEKYPNVQFPTLIHHNAHVSKHSNIGMGTILCSDVNVTVNVEIGDFAIIDLGSSISHGSYIGDFSILHPASTICGDVSIEPLVEIGAGSTIIPGIHIGSHSIIGAGSAVTQNIPASVVAYGVPCKVRRNV